MPTILVRRTRGGAKTLVATLRAQADRMLAHLGLEAAELSVTLVSDEAIQELNRTHRGKDKPTDVLAFPLGEAPAPGLPRLLGDVVISLPTAERQAMGRKRPLLPEARFLMAHGLLHLIGYDHATRAQKRRMDAATRRLVRAATAPRTRASKTGPTSRTKRAVQGKIGRKAPSARRSR